MAKIIFTYHAENPELFGPLTRLLSHVRQGMAIPGGVSADLFKGVAEDPFRTDDGVTGPTLAAIAVLSAPSGLPIRQLEASIVSLTKEISSELEVECSLLVACQNTFKSIAGASINYLYFMTRKQGLCAADYMDYYVNRHSAFGMRTQGIGYVQNYVDLMETWKLANELDVNALEFDSVSEMLIRTLPDFLQENDVDEIARLAAEDEERFVDRASSFMLCLESFH